MKINVVIFKLRQPLSNVMNIDGCHLCRTCDAFDAMTVDMVTHSLATEFTGRFDFILHAAVVDKQGDTAAEKPDLRYVDEDVSTAILIVSFLQLFIILINFIHHYQKLNAQSLNILHIPAT